jgi:ATP-binding cassette, subfamily G (WHITE), member 2, PDR
MPASAHSGNIKPAESSVPPFEAEIRSPLDLMDQSEIDNLVRVVSEQQRDSSIGSTKGDQATLTPDSDDDSLYDSTSPNFDLRKWLLRTLQTMDQEGTQTQDVGVVFKDLSVSGSGSALQLQQTLATTFTGLFRPDKLIRRNVSTRRILRNFNGLLKPGEMVLVLGRPGAGCSTMLKTICGETHGLTLENKEAIRFNGKTFLSGDIREELKVETGISQSQMVKEFKGEVVYNQEVRAILFSALTMIQLMFPQVEKHFPHLTVGQTLEFAAATRTPSTRPAGMTRPEFVKLTTQVIMAIFGLSHTYNTKVGNDYIRGVSGGERKRVSIAEMALAGAPVGAWDNSTRGLDSATALKFVQCLRLFSDVMRSVHFVAAYQASQSIYDLFDKVIVLYEGRQIYYGPASTAKEYFERQGWECPPRQTTGDFLTSVTNPQERRARPGMKQIVPRSADDFEAYWQQSPEYQNLQADIAAYETEYPAVDKESGSGEALKALQRSKWEAQADHTRQISPFRISVPMQIRLNIKRAYQRIWNDMASTVSNLGGQIILALVISSVFYDSSDDTSGISSRCATLFFAVMLNALSAMNEINSLYSQRPIVEKHASYAFYHPFTEAIAGVLSDIPLKFALTVVFNVILYFMTNLRHGANHFFLYFLVTFVVTLTMSAIFRTLAAVTKTISQAMSLAGVMVLALVIYAGFVLPVPSMHPWFQWIHYLSKSSLFLVLTSLIGD